MSATRNTSPLVAAVQRLSHAGTPQAVERACTHFLNIGVPPLLRHCWKLVRLHDAHASYSAMELACDAVADAALLLRTHPASFSADAAVVGYLKRCASRLVLHTVIRGGHPSRAFGIDVARLQTAVQQAMWPSAVSTTPRDRQIRTGYLRALRSLPRRQRQTLRLMLERGATLEMVHRTLGVSIATAYRAKRAGLQALRVRLLPLWQPAPPPRAVREPVPSSVPTRTLPSAAYPAALRHLAPIPPRPGSRARR